MNCLNYVRLGIGAAALALSAPAMAAVAPISQAAPTPTTAAVRAFASLCEGTSDADEPAARALAAGWSEQQPEQGSELALLVGLHQPDVRGRTFVSGEGGKRVHLWVRMTQPVRVAECSIYIFDVAAPEAVLDDVIAWRGVAPEIDLKGEGEGERAVGWSAADGSTIVASIERFPCPTRRSCRPQRVVIQRSREMAG